MNTKQRVSALRGRASCRFGRQRVGGDRISLPRNPQGRKIATNNFGIREMSDKGLFPGRERDLLGVAASYGRIGDGARGLDRDEIRFTGTGGTIHDYEAVLEITYEARIAPWWTLQPDFQLIAHPGGHVAPPSAAFSARPIPNALVLGLRSSIVF